MIARARKGGVVKEPVFHKQIMPYLTAQTLLGLQFEGLSGGCPANDLSFLAVKVFQ
jgi:hypothetical protein